MLGTALVVKTRAFASATSWLDTPAVPGSALAACAASMNDRLEAAAKVLCGGSWLHLGHAQAPGDGEDDAPFPARVLLSRVLAWCLLLSYTYALVVAVS